MPQPSQLPIIDKHTRRVAIASDAKMVAKAIEATDSGPGWIEGYAATWDNIDLQGEMMIKGCFARSIEQAIPARRVKLMAKHATMGGDVLHCIGTVTVGKEDDYGFWIHAELSKIQIAQDVRTLVLEQHVNWMSVCFKALRYENRFVGEGEAKLNVIAHLESKLDEVTTTCFPANEIAEITGAKSVAPQTTAPGDTAKALIVTPTDLARMRHEQNARRARLLRLGK